jgi:hypothetical protein
MKKLAKVKRDLEIAREKLAEAEAAYKKYKEDLKKTCTHPRTKIVEQSAMEVGRMSGPFFWKEKICTRCKKVLATYSQEVMEVWHETTEIN